MTSRAPARTDQLEWTPEGQAALAKERTHGPPRRRGDSDEQLAAAIATVIARYAPAWDRGASKADDAGRHAAARASTFEPTQRLSVDDAAGVLSLCGARAAQKKSEKSKKPAKAAKPASRRR